MWFCVRDVASETESCSLLGVNLKFLFRDIVAKPQNTLSETGLFMIHSFWLPKLRFWRHASC